MAGEYGRAIAVTHINPQATERGSEFTKLGERAGNVEAAVGDRRPATGITGETHAALQASLDAVLSEIRTMTARARDRAQIYAEARGEMVASVAEIQRLSPQLISSAEQEMLRRETPAPLADEVIAGWKENNRAHRDALAAQILERMNQRVHEKAERLRKFEAPTKPVDHKPDDAAAVVTGAGMGAGVGLASGGWSHGVNAAGSTVNPGGGAPTGGVGGPNGKGAPGPGVPAVGAPGATGPGGSGSVTPGGPGVGPSGPRPIEITGPDGKTGVYTPAPIGNRDDPRWDSGYRMPGRPTVGAIGALGSGIGGVGMGAVASRLGAGGASLNSGAGFASAGYAGARTPGGGMTAGGTAGGGVAGPGTAGGVRAVASGALSANGTGIGANGPGASNASGGGMMSPGGVGAAEPSKRPARKGPRAVKVTQTKAAKKSVGEQVFGIKPAKPSPDEERKRRRYGVERMSEEPADPQDHAIFGPGSTEQLEQEARQAREEQRYRRHTDRY